MQLPGDPVIVSTRRPPVGGGTTTGSNVHLTTLTLRRVGGFLRHHISPYDQSMLYGQEIGKIERLYADWPDMATLTLTGTANIAGAVPIGNTTIPFKVAVPYGRLNIGTVLAIGGSAPETVTVTDLPVPPPSGNVYAYPTVTVHATSAAHADNDPVTWNYTETNPVAPRDQIWIPGEPVPFYVVQGVSPVPGYMISIDILVESGT